MSLRWGSRPPVRVPDPSIRVFTVKGTSVSYVRLLEAPKCLWVHWLGFRSYPCDDEACPHCPDTPLNWKGYACGVVLVVDAKQGRQAWRRHVVELTDNAIDAVKSFDLGATLTLRRAHAAKNAPVLVELAKEQNTFPLPEPWDPVPYLYRMWGIHRTADSSSAHTSPQNHPLRLRFDLPDDDSGEKRRAN